MSDDSASLTPFIGEDGSHLVRKQLHDGRLFLSVVDVVGLLTDSSYPARYWTDMKRRLAENEGFVEVYAKCVTLKMRSVDGKMREAEAADTETLLRIIQSIPSPKAEPVKRWLAEVGAERINEATDLDGLTEDQRRIYARSQIEDGNKSLSAVAGDSGVVTSRDFAVFHDAGYVGLYNGERMRDIHARKGLAKGQHILDHMDSEELAANLFRVTQTTAKLRRDPVSSKTEANRTHFEVGQRVRQTIADLGGTMPEELPTPAESIRQVRARERQRELGGEQQSLFGPADDGGPSDPEE